MFRLFCLLSVNCLPLTIKVRHTIRLTDTSGNIKFGLEHMHIFISVSSYRDLYSGTKPFSLHLGLFRFVDKSGSIFYDLIFLFLNFIFHITSMALTVDAHSLYRCLVFSTTATCSMWMSCTLWFCHSSRTYLTAGSFLMQSEQKERAVKFKWGNERAKLHDRLPPIKKMKSI